MNELSLILLSKYSDRNEGDTPHTWEGWGIHLFNEMSEQSELGLFSCRKIILVVYQNRRTILETVNERWNGQVISPIMLPWVSSDISASAKQEWIFILGHVTFLALSVVAILLISVIGAPAVHTDFLGLREKKQLFSGRRVRLSDFGH